MSHPKQEDDRIRTGFIAVVGLVSVVCFVLGIWWARTIQRSEQPGAAAAEVGKPEVGIVYQTPFAQSRFAEDKAANKRARLSSYGWVDRAHKVIHIPIERAMDQLAGGEQ